MIMNKELIETLKELSKYNTYDTFKIVKSTTIASEYIEKKGDKDYLSLLKSLKKEQLYALILLNENFKNELEVLVNENENII